MPSRVDSADRQRHGPSGVVVQPTAQAVPPSAAVTATMPSSTPGLDAATRSRPRPRSGRRLGAAAEVVVLPARLKPTVRVRAREGHVERQRGLEFDVAAAGRGSHLFAFRRVRSSRRRRPARPSPSPGPGGGRSASSSRERPSARRGRRTVRGDQASTREIDRTVLLRTRPVVRSAASRQYPGLRSAGRASGCRTAALHDGTVTSTWTGPAFWRPLRTTKSVRPLRSYRWP